MMQGPAVINGVGVVVSRDDSVLLGHRTSGPWRGTWCLPGGKIDPFESFEQCGARELLEETGLRAQGPCELLTTSYEICAEREFHSLTIGLMFSGYSGEVANQEPHKFAEWSWFSLSKLPTPLFPPTASVLRGYSERSGKPLSRSASEPFPGVSSEVFLLSSLPPRT